MAATADTRPQCPTADIASGTSLPILIIVMALTIVPMIATSQIIGYWRVDVVDDQMFGYYGWRIAHGATVYKDVWDNKPPGIYWVNALGMWVGHDSYLGVVAMCAAAMVAAHAAFYVVAASVFHRSAAALATILLSFFLTHGYYTGGTNRTETFLVAFELLGMACYMRGWARDRVLWWYAAGLFCGLAFLFKQVGLAAWGCMGLHTIVLMLTGALPWGQGVKRGVLLVAGAATSVAAAAAYLASQGALGEAYFATFGFNAAYFAHGESQFPYNLVTWTLLREHIWPNLLLPILMAVAACIHALLWWWRPEFRPLEIEAPLRALRPVCPRHVLLFSLWFVVALYGAMMSPHGFRHYVVPSIPPLLLLAGYLINVLRAEKKLLRRFQQRAWVLAAFVAMGYFSYETVIRQFEEVSRVWVHRVDPWLFAHGFYGAESPGVMAYKPAYWEVVAQEIDRVSAPDDTLQCLGYMPGVYLHARRLNVSRFTTTEKIGQVQNEASWIARELETTLAKNPPVLLVMSAGDYRALYMSASELKWPAWERLGAWTDEHYQLVADVAQEGGIFIFKRRDRIDPTRDPDLTERLRLTTQPG